MRTPILVLCLAAAGCNRTTEAPSCDAMADHVRGLFGGASDTYAGELRAAFATRCTQDQWAAEMRSCVAGTKSLVEPQSCKQKLTPDQATKLDADLAAVDERAAMLVIPGACTRYEKLLASVRSCEVLPQAARDQLEKNFETFKATWPSVPDKRSLEPICGSAIQTVKAAAATCPGAATW